MSSISTSIYCSCTWPAIGYRYVGYVTRSHVTHAQLICCRCAIFYRMTILFFGLSGLDVLDSLSVISDEDRAGMVDWIYSQQILPNTSGSNLHQCGFRGASFIGAPFHSTASSSQVPSPDLLRLEVIGINEGVCCLSTYIAVKFSSV